MSRLSKSLPYPSLYSIALLGLSASYPLLGQAETGGTSASVNTGREPTPSTLVASALVVEVHGDKDSKSNQEVSRLGKVRDVPQSITVLDSGLMQAQGSTSLTSALRNVPGLTIGAAEGGQIGTNINLNGFSARTDMYLDGGRDRGQYYRDVFALESVEVLMGPSSMLFGRGSTGGVINQVSKKPIAKDFTEVQASANTFGLVRTVLDHNSQISDDAAWRVAAMAQHGKASNRDQTDLSDFGIAPSVQFGMDGPTRITLSALLQHNRDMVDYGVPNLNGKPLNPVRDAAYGYSDDRTISDVASLGAQVEHSFTPDLKVRNQLQFNRVDTDARETAANTLGTIASNGSFVALSNGSTATPLAIASNLPLQQLWVRQQSHDRVIRDTSLFNLTELTATLNTGALTHHLLGGVEFGYDTYRNQNAYRNGSCNGLALNSKGSTAGYSNCVPLLTPGDQASPVTAPSVPGNLATGNAHTAAVFLNDSFEWTPEWKLVAGIRHDRYAANIGNSISNANVLASTSQVVNFNSVRTGAIWQPNAQSSYYLSYSTSFNPSLEQLVSTTGGTSPLPPQINHAYELGGKWDLDQGRLQLSSAVFDITQRNARSQDVSGLYSATGTVEVKGARAGLVGKLSKAWTIFAGYTHLDATIIDGIAPATQGKTPANTPSDTASVWSTYAFNHSWQVGAGVNAVGARFANNTDLVRAPGYVRWDAMGEYHCKHYDLRLNVFNLFNRAYYDALIPSDGGRAVPGAARSATVTINYRF